MATPSNKEIIDFILKRFNEDELRLFNISYFPEVEHDIGSGMSKRRKVVALFEYCKRREMMRNLLGALQQERPSLYQTAFPQQPKITALPTEIALKPRDPKQLFISYSSKDEKLAQRIAKDLQAHGFDIFITPNSIHPGEEWVPAISRGLDESGIFLILLTPNALNSKWVRKEVHTAIALNHANEARLLFLDVADCKPPSLWRQWQFLSFRNRRYKQNLQILLAELNNNGLQADASQSEKHDTNPTAPSIDKQQPELKVKLYKQYQLIPVWLKWGIGLILALLIVTGIGNVILESGGNGEDNPPVNPVTLDVVSPTAPLVVVEVTRSPTQEPTATAPQPTATLTAEPTATLTVEPTATTEPAATTEPTVTSTATVEPTIDANRPPQNAALGDSWQRPADEMTMVYVPSGTFSMGSDDGRSNEQPIHEVTLDGFWIDQTEVTNEQYELCIADGKCERFEYYDTNDTSEKQQPVIEVSWHDANAYCTLVGARLSTEAEWEYVARGSEGNTYPWGNAPPTCDLLNYNRKYGNCSPPGTTPVGSYSPEGDSWVGASDMAGNVWEWVHDWYDSDYYANADANNPTGPQDGDTKVMRGGGINNYTDLTRSSYRRNIAPAGHDRYFGFRCASSGN